MLSATRTIGVQPIFSELQLEAGLRLRALKFGPTSKLGALAGALLAACCAAAQAGDGLKVNAPESIWPQWQARISLQSGPTSGGTLALANARLGGWGLAQAETGQGAAALLGPAGAGRGIQGAALLGDYYFARPSFGSFRASGGVIVGAIGGLPLAPLGGNGPAASSWAPLGLSLTSGASAPVGLNAHSDALPYLGLGFSSSLWQESLSISADLGLAAGRLSAAADVGRAVFGNQGLYQALRDMRLTPVVQLGVRYSF